MEWPQQRWETRVIHLNLNNKPGGEARPQSQQQPKPQADPPADPAKPLFSEAYLKEEFPNHYSEQSGQPPQPPVPPKPQHPATQLQSFMNKLGSEGWEFVGVYPIGQLTMMMFRRPLPPEQPAASADQSTAVGPSTASAAPAPSPAAADPGLQGVLQQILQRLEALEQRPAATTPAQPMPLPGSSSQVSAAQVLSPLQLQALPPNEPLPTAKAAQALGLRSPASLLNFGARHGYSPGLVKRAANGLAAVYRGEAQRQNGGKALRLWSVVPQSALPQL